MRASWFAQNFSEDYLRSRSGGEMALPAADVPEPFIDVDDIADVAVAALTTDGHVGRIHELTGPRLLTFADAAAEIARGRRSRRALRRRARRRYTGAMVEPASRAEHVAITELFTDVLDGRNANVTDGVERALGRPARDFARLGPGRRPRRVCGTAARWGVMSEPCDARS